MENKKYLPIKIVHLILMVIAIIFCCISLTKPSQHVGSSYYTALRSVSYITEIIALISGIVYLAHGYKKNAAAYYKAFMIILVVSQALFIYRQLIGIAPQDALTSNLVAIFNIIPLIMLTILATGKDLGKTKSYIVVAIIFACRLGIVILDFAVKGVFNTPSTIFSFRVSDILLAATAFFMVTGKYIDKAERGTK